MRVLTFLLMILHSTYAWADYTPEALLDYTGASPSDVTEAVINHKSALQNRTSGEPSERIRFLIEQNFPGWDATIRNETVRSMYGPPLTAVSKKPLPRRDHVKPRNNVPQLQRHANSYSGPSRVYFSNPEAESLFLSPFKADRFNVSGEIYFLRTDGIPRAGQKENPAISYEFHTQFNVIAPSGAQVIATQTEPLTTQECAKPERTSVPVTPICGYTVQRYRREHPISRDAEEGQWTWQLQFEVLKLNKGTVEKTLYSGQLGGGFVIDRTAPQLTFEMPGEGSMLGFPQESIQVVFGIGDMESGLDQQSLTGSVEGAPIDFNWLSENKISATIDAGALIGQVYFHLSVVDKAGNVARRRWPIEIVSPEDLAAREAAESAIVALAPVLGLPSLDSIKYEHSYQDSAYLGDTTDAAQNDLIINFEQIGPGGFVVEGTGLRVVTRDGFVTEVYSSIATETATLQMPPSLIKQDEALGIARYATSSLSPNPFPKFMESVQWSFDTVDSVWRLVYLIVPVYGDLTPRYMVKVDAETGFIHEIRPFRTGFNADIAWVTEHVTYDSTGDIGTVSLVTTNSVESGYSFYTGSDGNSYLSSEYVLPANYHVPIVNNHVYRNPISQLNPMKKTTEMNQYFKGRFGNSFYWPYSKSTQAYQWVEIPRTADELTASAGALFNECTWDDVTDYWSGNCDFKLSTLEGVELRYTSGTYTDQNGNTTPYYNYGVDPSTAYHETTHAILYSMGWLAGTKTISRFHEGMAEATECLYYRAHCPYKIGCLNPFTTNTIEPRYYCTWFDSYIDTEYLNDDEWGHYAGFQLAYASIDLEQRLQDYLRTPVERPGLYALWNAAKRVTFGNSDVLLGAMADAYINAVAATMSVRDFNEFKWEVYYFFQHHAMGVGTNAGKSAHTANLAGYFAEPAFGSKNTHELGENMRIVMVASGESVSHWVLEFYKNNAGSGEPCATKGGFSGFLGTGGLFNSDEDDEIIKRKVVNQSVIDEAIRSCFSSYTQGTYDLYVKYYAVNFVLDTDTQIINAVKPPSTTLPRLRIAWPGPQSSGGDSGGGGCLAMGGPATASHILYMLGPVLLMNRRRIVRWFKR